MLSFIGNSHLSAVARGAAKFGSRDCTFVQLPHVAPYSRSPDGKRLTLSDPVADAVQAALKDAKMLVSLIGGNGHNIFGLVEMQPRIDLYDPTIATIDANRTLLPRALVKTGLQRQVRFWLQLMRDVRALTPASMDMIHVAPPPPIGDDSHILANPGPFSEPLSAYGLAPPSLRLKLWRLHIEILEACCQEGGIRFLKPEIDWCTHDGFLLPEFYGNDPSHANEDYGRRILQQVENIVRQL